MPTEKIEPELPLAMMQILADVLCCQADETAHCDPCEADPAPCAECDRLIARTQFNLTRLRRQIAAALEEARAETWEQAGTSGPATCFLKASVAKTRAERLRKGE